METMTPATTQAKGMAGMPAERGGGLLVEDSAAVAAAAGTAAVAEAAYCRGRRECNIPVSSKKWAQRSGKEAIRPNLPADKNYFSLFSFFFCRM
jgi:hypothetical protein